ncbi:MAG: T9SS type A sorting domain-containing protein [Crocinitomicaceae bacterium]|nr:T9SS type A sorting domain-containing protein [Crocinitomicaceae bacterium]
MKHSILLVCIVAICNLAHSQAPFISNCPGIPTDGYIESSIISNATQYDFKLVNMNTSNGLVQTSTSNNISLSAFSSIITYNSPYEVTVRALVDPGEEPYYTEWSETCGFELMDPPSQLIIENYPCGSEIGPDDLIYCTQFYTATCYTFYVTNVTTGQSANTGCIPDNYFTLNSLGINFSPGDVISMYVSYTIGEEVMETSRACEYRIKGERPFCFVIKDDYDPTLDIPNQAKTIIPGQTVGNNFYLTYLDNTSSSDYASAVWEPDAVNMFNTAIAVLEDLDAFLDFNFVNDNCGNPNQRILIALRPYKQVWVDWGWYTTALAVAGQAVLPVDVNYLSQGCVEVPSIQLATISGPHGGSGVIAGGTVYFNPTISNFNSSYPSPTTGGDFDLYSVILHEITHILGINLNDFKYHNMVKSNGVNIEHPDLLNCTQPTNYNALVTATCDFVHFVGNYTNDKVYAPTTFSSGSSIGHFVDDCNGSPQGGNVMNPGLNPNDDSKRFYHQREINALQDLGYNFSNPFNGTNYTLNNTLYIVGNHDGLEVMHGPNNFGFSCDSDPYTPIVQEICGSWPLIIHPLDNDINATFIDEAVLKTGAANATIVNTGTEIEFTPTQPGVYTIAYVPANPERVGLPTYIQVSVPACGEADLDALTCHDASNCNQVCFSSEIYPHTLLRGNQFTEPSGFGGGSNTYFTVAAATAGNDHFGNSYSDCYSSIFFWVDADLNEEYSISFDRDYHEYGPMNGPNPNMSFFVYLMKSSQVLDGSINQSANEFPNLNIYDKQLIYEGLITADHIWTQENISLCFTANDEYDMLVFIPIKTSGATRRFGKIGIENLEFMEKEFPNLPAEVEACIPEILDLGEVFCATQGNSFSWVSAENNSVLSTNQVYSPGIISSPIIDQYIFSLNYNPLPTTAINPSDNSTCNQSYSVSITYDNCCIDGSVPEHHPLTPDYYSMGTQGIRTFGQDVDADNNGALFYCGEYVGNIIFGSETLTNTISPAGFIVKFENNCTDWLVETGYRYGHMDVSNSGKVFYSAKADWITTGDTYFAQFDETNGNVIWDWNAFITGPNTPYITDFKLNEVDNHIILVGHATGAFTYDGVNIPVTSTDAFILKVDYNGNYLWSNIITSSVVDPKARVAVDGQNVYVAYQSTSTEWIVGKFDYLTLTQQGSPTPRVFASTVGWDIQSIDLENLNLALQVVSDNPVNDITGSTTILTFTPGTLSTGLITLDNSIVSTSGTVLGPLFASNNHLWTVDMDIYNGAAFVSYVNDNGVLEVSSFDAGTGGLNWNQSSTPPANSWVGNRSVRSTPLGTFNTGSFFWTFNITGTLYNLYANSGTTFYGLKYDANGNPVAMEVPIMEVKSPTDIITHDESTVAGTVGSNESNSNIKIYPNPGKDIFTLETEGEHSVTVMNSNGQEVIHFNGSHLSKFDLSNFAPGIYIVRVQTNSEIQFIKVVRE